MNSKENKAAMDIAMIDEIIKKSDIDVIDALNNTNLNAKEDFLNNCDIMRPRNEYGNLNIDIVRDNIKVLQEYSILNLKGNSFETKMYRYIIDSIIDKNKFVEANYAFNQCCGPDKYPISEHRCLNERLYGKPDINIFETMLYEKISMINYDLLSDEKKRIYDELLRLLDGVEYSKRCDFQAVNDAVKSKFENMVQVFFEPILKYIDCEKEKYTITEACEIANNIIEHEFGAKKYDWTAVVEKGGSVASVSQEKKVVSFPEKRSRGDYTLAELKSIMVHEVGTHMLRSLAFSDYKIKSLSIGMPFYETFEEGVAKVVDQAINRSYGKVGYTHYISIGLIYFGNKNFRECFEIQKRLEHLTSDEPAGRCFDSVQRAFRGTGILPNNKDLVYFNGYMKVWKYIEEHIEDKNLLDDLFFSGKTDPTIPIHRELINKARIGL